MERLQPVLAAVVILVLAGCRSAETVLDGGGGQRTGSDTVEAAAASADSDAPVLDFHQGFDHDTEGWYDGGDDAPWGWCGTLEQVDGRDGPAPRPSAGRGYALASAGPCNDHWSQFLPGGAPYAPGPGGSLLSDEWPAGGYVTELDVYLDPSWSGAYEGTLSPNSIVQLGATVFELDYQIPDFHPFPHWIVSVDALPDQEALAVFDRRIDEAGWYTFRFAFSGEDGEVEAAFELRDRRGDVLARVELEPLQLSGPAIEPFEGGLPTAEYGSGHVWFFDIASGLQLPIDEHRVRQGR